MAFSPFSQPLTLVASTGIAGVALVNGTPTILSWTAPNDGQLHQVICFLDVNVSVAATGGAIQVNYTDPGGTAATLNPIGGGQGVGTHNGAATVLVGPGSTVTVSQGALTVGAAKLYAQIFAA